METNKGKLESFYVTIAHNGFLLQENYTRGWNKKYVLESLGALLAHISGQCLLQQAMSEVQLPRSEFDELREQQN